MTFKTYIDPGGTYQMPWTSDPISAPRGNDVDPNLYIFQTDQPEDSIVTLEGRLAPEGSADGMGWFPIVSHTRALGEAGDKSQASSYTSPAVTRVRIYGAGSGTCRAWTALA